MRYVFGKVPILADVFPSRAIEAQDASIGVCPDRSFEVLDDGCGTRRYTFSFAIVLDVAVLQNTYSLLKAISDPQTAIGKRQQTLDDAFCKLAARFRYIPFEVNAIESKEPDIRTYPQKSIPGLCQSL